MKVSVSFLSSNYNTKETIKKIDESIADYIHVDLMDGKFVSNKNFTAGDITNLLKDATKPLDVHLMVSKPLKYLETFAFLNTEYLTFHYEAVKDPLSIIEKIKNLGLKVGMSLKPQTSIEEIIPFIKYLDLILVMSVEPGAGGQEFITSVIPKIEELNKLKKDFNFIISVDGGINEQTVSLIKEHADMIVSGSFVCKSDNFNNQINLIK